jgi:hypothetical protein
MKMIVLSPGFADTEVVRVDGGDEVPPVLRAAAVEVDEDAEEDGGVVAAAEDEDGGVVAAAEEEDGGVVAAAEEDGGGVAAAEEDAGGVDAAADELGEGDDDAGSEGAGEGCEVCTSLKMNSDPSAENDGKLLSN